MRNAVLFVTMLLTLPAQAAEPFRLGLPVACKVGKACWVQQYPDHDPTSGVKDYACGTQTYDGHDGIDIRIRDTAASAEVIAAASGIVRSARDGFEDHLMQTPEDRVAVGNFECGNGVVIAHSGGYATQYCHLRQGSLAVKFGQRVEAGGRLGLVGYSGMAAFPHVHFSVRKHGKNLDPFRPADDPESCGAGKDALWTDEALTALAYVKGAVLRSGFAADRVEVRDLESGGLSNTPIAADWPALVSYGWTINLEKGDVIRLTLSGPDGIAADNTVTLDRAKAQYLLFAGKKRPPSGWPKGDYLGSFEVRNGSTVKLTRSWSQRLD